jgi:TRAP-type C4-dicarboxylate transport system substrate-binding protein
MKKLFLIPFVIVLTVAFVFTGCAPQQATELPGGVPAGFADLPEISWAFQTTENAWDYPSVIQQVQFCERVTRRTEGKFTLTPYLTGELGVSRDEAPNAIARGEIEMGNFQSGHGEAIIPQLGVFHLPYLAYDYDEWWQVEAAVLDVIREAFKEKGFQMVGNSYQTVPYQDLTTVEPIDDLCDLGGTKIRTSRKLDIDLVNEMGGEGIYMDFAEVYMAMQRGVIGGLITGPQAMEASSIYEVSNYVYPIHLPPVSMWLIVNSDLYEALPEYYKKVLTEEANALSEIYRPIGEEYVEVSLLKLVARGMTRRDPTDAERACWQENAVALWDGWADTPERQEVLALAKQARGL